ncbi:MAG: substrate-binding domain-containing protein [Lachnospiraceae bacterium]|nr:substrate-binding domain-containing protein [Lachnospiraceae bacterium]
MRTKIFSIIIIILSALCICACSQPAQKDKADSAPAITHCEPLTEIKDGRKNIYLIVKVIDSNYWQVIINGAKAAGEELDCNVYYCGTNIETDWKGQHLLVDEVLAKNPDAVILAPNDSVELASDIDKVHAMGIPIVLIDTAANTESFDICYMTDNLLAGQNAAEEMISQLRQAGYSGNDNVSVGILVGYAQSMTINERLAGFYQYWSNHAPEKWIVISDIMNCNGDFELGKKITAEFLIQHPELNGLYGTNNTPARALGATIKKENRTDITVVAFDYSDEIKTLVESPDYRVSTILQRQYDMGYSAVQSTLDILDGNTPSIKFKDTGVVTVNKDTLSDPLIQEVIEHN